MNNPFIGTILYFGFDWAPDGWGRCDGKPIPIRGKESLFKLIGTTYGGDGVSTFGIPNLIGRGIVGQNDLFPLGTPGGLPQVTIRPDQMPPHTHTVAAIPIAVSSLGAGSQDPTNNYFAKQDGRENNYAVGSSLDSVLAPLSITVNPAGGSAPINTAMPFQALNPCIAFYGIYPGRG